MASSDDIHDTLVDIKNALNETKVNYSQPTYNSAGEITTNHWHMAVLIEFKRMNQLLGQLVKK